MSARTIAGAGFVIKGVEIEVFHEGSGPALLFLPGGARLDQRAGYKLSRGRVEVGFVRSVPYEISAVISNPLRIGDRFGTQRAKRWDASNDGFAYAALLYTGGPTKRDLQALASLGLRS